jgi:tRNA (guanine-N1)-methyltransferase
MRIDIITVVPELLESPLSHSIVGRAIKKGLVEIHVHNLRKYGKGPRQQVDDYSYGGDAGMVLMLEPVYKMIEELKAEREYGEIIYMSPDGEILNQNIANELSLKENIILLCGHYKGIDHRIREHLITREISVGDALYFTDMTGNRYTYAVKDIRYEKHANQAALASEDAALVLFIKNIFAFEYVIIFCDVPG